MIIAATTAAAALKTLRQEIPALEAEIRVLADKREVEEKVLAILTAQRRALSESVARGTMKSAAAALKQKIDFSKAALDEFDRLLCGPTKRLEEAYGELRKLEEQAISSIRCKGRTARLTPNL